MIETFLMLINNIKINIKNLPLPARKLLANSVQTFANREAMARHENPFDMQIKLLMIGDSGEFINTSSYVSDALYSPGVGKTCLLLRYANDSFSPTFITTIGIDFKIKNIELDGKRIKLQVCEPCGY